MIMNVVLTAAGIKPEVQQFFLPWQEVQSEDMLIAKFMAGKTHEKEERISPSGSLVPSTVGIWSAGAHHPAIARHHFLFYSVLEAMCFCNIHHDWLKRPGSVVFSALGLLPLSNQIISLTSRFSNAKLHTVFGNDLPARILDCKIGLWSKGKDAIFELEDDVVIIHYREKIFHIPEPLFSLNRFELKSGLRAQVRTHKPPVGYASFKALLKATSV